MMKNDVPHFSVREVPHSLEAEQSVIGSLLLNNDAIDRIGDLRAVHFFNAEHRAIFSVVAGMIGAGKPSDVVTVFEAMRHQTDRTGLLSYLNDLASNTPSAANIRVYAEIVRERAIRRAILVISDEMAGMVDEGSDDAATILDKAGARIEALSATRTGSDPVLARDDLAAHLAVIEQRTDGKVRVIGTGYPHLDKNLNGGIRPGQVLVVAGRPKMGKSVLGLNIACHVARDHRVLVLSMEMSSTEIHDRNLASLGRLPLSCLLQPQAMQDQDWSQVMAAAARINDLDLYIDDQGGLRLIDVRMKARRVKRRHGLDLLVVDYLQLMEGPGDNRNAQIEAVTRGLKALAKELDLGIIVLSQLNRDLEKRDNKRPIPSDLRDSGSIEQDADVVLFLYRDEVYHPDSIDRGICEVNVALNRQGAPGRVALAFIGEQVRFESLAHQWRPATPVAPRRAKQFDPDP